LGNVAYRAIINVNNLSVSGILSLTSGQLDIGSNNLILGVTSTNTPGTLTYTTNSQILTSSGGSFTRVFGAAALPTSIATGNIGHFPFGRYNTYSPYSNQIERRDVFVMSSNSGTFSIGGYIQITPTATFGTTAVSAFTDGSLTG